MKEDKNKIEKSIYRFILKHTSKDQVLLLLLTLASMPIIYASLEIPKIIINSAINGQDIPEKILGISIDQITYLLALCLVFLLLVLIAGGLKYLTNVYRGVVGERMLRRFRYDMFSRILRFPNRHFKQVSQAELLPMITSETEPLGGFIGDAFALPAFQGGLLITYLFFIFNQDFLLGLAAIALYPPQIYLIPKLQSKVNQLSKKRVQAVRHLSDKLGETISGVSDIHINDTSHFEQAHVSTRLGKIFHIRLEIYRRKFFIKFLNNFLGQLTPFFFYSIGGYFVIKGELSLGALVAVLAAYKDLATPWRELLKFYQITEDVRVKYTQIIKQFEPDDMLDPDLQKDQDITVNTAALTIVGTALEYSEDDYIKTLDGVSLSVKPGEHVAIIGPGGSGRGCFARLLVRLLNPDSGHIKLSELNIAELSEAVLGRNISYVDTQSFVFNETVMSNLVYGLKTRAVSDFSYSPEEAQIRQTQITEAMGSGNSTDDIRADWINLASAEFDSETTFYDHLLEVLKITYLEQDVYQLGLYASIDPKENEGLSGRILDARKNFRKILVRSDKKNLVELLAQDQYNQNLSVAENLFFGTPIENDPHFHKLINSPDVQSVLESTGLGRELFAVGIQTARTLSEIFSDIPDGSPLFERFSFVDADQLPVLAKISKLPNSTLAAEVERAEADLIFNLSLKLTVARHRLGLITEALQKSIVSAHQLLRKQLGQNNNLIEFYHQDQTANHLSIQDNILFGRIAYGQANAKEKVGKLIDEFVSESGLREEILTAGLEYNVGVAGARLTAIQRQKLTIARALIKNPDILVVNEAVVVFDKRIASQITHNILAAMDNKIVIWVLSENDLLKEFDRVIVMNKGKVVSNSTSSEILDNPEILSFMQ